MLTLVSLISVPTRLFFKKNFNLPPSLPAFHVLIIPSCQVFLVFTAAILTKHKTIASNKIFVGQIP